MSEVDGGTESAQTLGVDKVPEMAPEEQKGGSLLKLVERVEGKQRKRRFLMLLRKQKRLTMVEGNQIVKLLREDPYLDPWSAFEQVRRINAPGRHLFTVEVEDSRVVRAVMVASEGLGSSPEEYILAKLLEGVVTDGYLKSEVLDQLRVKKYVEESLPKERRKRFDP